MRKTEYDLYDYLFPDIKNSLSFGESCSLCHKDYNFIGQEIIWGNGVHDSKIMVIGKDSTDGNNKEILWKGSKYTKIPLTNKKSGARIRIMIHKAGINPHEVFFTNTFKCNTGQDEYNLSSIKLKQFLYQIGKNNHYCREKNCPSKK